MPGRPDAAEADGRHPRRLGRERLREHAADRLEVGAVDDELEDLRIAVDVKVILVPPCIFCTENH